MEKTPLPFHESDGLEKALIQCEIVFNDFFQELIHSTKHSQRQRKWLTRLESFLEPADLIDFTG